MTLVIITMPSAQAQTGVQAIKNAYAGIEVALENEDIVTLMSYFSDSFLNYGEDKDFWQIEFMELFNNYKNIQTKFSQIKVTVNGDTATTTLHATITAEPQGGGRLKRLWMGKHLRVLSIIGLKRMEFGNFMEIRNG